METGYQPRSQWKSDATVFGLCNYLTWLYLNGHVTTEIRFVWPRFVEIAYSNRTLGRWFPPLPPNIELPSSPYLEETWPSDTLPSSFLVVLIVSTRSWNLFYLSYLIDIWQSEMLGNKMHRLESYYNCLGRSMVLNFWPRDACWMLSVWDVKVPWS